MVDTTPKLALKDIRISYPNSMGGPKTLAVDLIGEMGLEAPNIKIAPAEFTVLLGPSGCGKSTLLRMLAGLIAPTEGQAYQDGQLIKGPGKERGMVFQKYTAFPWLTVVENIRFGLELSRSNTKNEIDDAVEEVLSLVGLQDASNKYPKELSGGMKQRVAIARTLINRPDVILMDEPFGALDPYVRLKLQDLLLDITEQLRTTIVFVTHDVREAVYLGDTIYISTLCPCFLQYRLEHPFEKRKTPRKKALKENKQDFILFQHEVEELLNEVIQNPDRPRKIEPGNWRTLNRSAMGLFEELDKNQY